MPELPPYGTPSLQKLAQPSASPLASIGYSGLKNTTANKDRPLKNKPHYSDSNKTVDSAI